ncbi:MAG: SDR family oxidoreductase [Streptococcaceae bacterium]|jgi:3-oxoacyl-[acyl-carrier protein] reductase|nr:SDR family oxidoreductase [Streptococcaceae bacterium]
MDLKLTNKTALVIASSDGLGKAIAQELANEGANVMLASRNQAKLASAVQEIQKTAVGKVDYTTFDQTSLESIESLIAQTRQKFGKIEILVNNSGGPKSGKFEDFNEQDWQDAYELTLLSYIRIIRAVLPDLKATQGRILNNTSSSVKEPIVGITLSNVFRMGISGLSKTLSQELAKDGILVNTIGAGRFNTERLKALHSDESNEAAQKQIPLGRNGEPEEFAKVATFLVSGANSYMTGQTILVEGGLVKSF